MPYSEKPVLIHYGNWSDETRGHPAMKWMEDYNRHTIEERGYEKAGAASEHYTPDMELQKPNGTVIKGADEVWKALPGMYARFAAQKHVPEFLICWETDDGWGMIGIATMYFNFDGLPTGTITDPDGRKWHGHGSGAFQFFYVRDGSSGIKLKQKRIFSDSSPAMKLMLQNKFIDGEQLARIVSGS